jgi:hypothetical protein
VVTFSKGKKQRRTKLEMEPNLFGGLVSKRGVQGHENRVSSKGSPTYDEAMKTKFLLPFLAPLCLSLSGCGAAKTPVDVIIMGGQSNMVGCSVYSGLKDEIGSSRYEAFERGMDGVKTSYDCWTKEGVGEYREQNGSKGKFVNVFLGQGNSDLTFGPEIGMAEAWNESRAGKLFLIKYACGASNLLDDWAAPSSGKKTTMYDNFVAYVSAQLQVLEDSGYAPTVRLMCWMQGEGDSYPGYYSEYYEQLTYLVKDLRKEFADHEPEEGFAFVDGGISDSPAWAYYKEVNEAKAQYAAMSERNVYIDTIAAGLTKDTLQDDNAHYRGRYMVRLGGLFADACEPFLSDVSQ